AWHRWTAWFLDRIAAAIDASRDRRFAWIEATRDLDARLARPDAARLLARRRHGRVALVRALRRHPYLTRQQFACHGLAQRTTAGKTLRALVRVGEARAYRHGVHVAYRIDRVASAFGVPPPADAYAPRTRRLALLGERLRPVDPHDA
ncbi:MAG: hypothetical protein WD336_02815, partial [Trueperaceae bacterium]